jgi:hypothetical protein
VARGWGWVKGGRCLSGLRVGGETGGGKREGSQDKGMDASAGREGKREAQIA